MAPKQQASSKGAGYNGGAAPTKAVASKSAPRGISSLRSSFNKDTSALYGGGASAAGSATFWIASEIEKAMANPKHVHVATFGMGWFWHPQSHFDTVGGVLKTTVGYTGGPDTAADTALGPGPSSPTYETVCSGDGHTEAIQVEYDASKITYDELLQHFWKQHNPMEGAKAQYKSAIYTHDKEQQKVAQAALEVRREKGLKSGTDIEPVPKWHDAEAYHQKHLQKVGAGELK